MKISTTGLLSFLSGIVIALLLMLFWARTGSSSFAVVMLAPTATFTSTSTPTNTPTPTITPTPTPTIVNKWQQENNSSAFDDRKLIAIYVEAEHSVTGKTITTVPDLYIRCMNKELNIFVFVKMVLEETSTASGEARVRTRYDEDKIDSGTMSLSTDSTGLFFIQPAKTLTTMLHAKTFSVEFTPLESSAVDTTFELSGLSDAIKPVAEACNIDLK